MQHRPGKGTHEPSEPEEPIMEITGSGGITIPPLSKLLEKMTEE